MQRRKNNKKKNNKKKNNKKAEAMTGKIPYNQTECDKKPIGSNDTFLLSDNEAESILHKINIPGSFEFLLPLESFAHEIETITWRRDEHLFLIEQPEFNHDVTSNYLVISKAAAYQINMEKTNLELAKFQVKAETVRNKGTEKFCVVQVKAKEESKNIDEATMDTLLPSGQEVDEEDIDLIINHTGCTREQAILAMKRTDNELVSGIMDLTK